MWNFPYFVGSTAKSDDQYNIVNENTNKTFNITCDNNGDNTTLTNEEEHVKKHSPPSKERSEVKMEKYNSNQSHDTNINSTPNEILNSTCSNYDDSNYPVTIKSNNNVNETDNNSVCKNDKDNLPSPDNILEDGDDDIALHGVSVYLSDRMRLTSENNTQELVAQEMSTLLEDTRTSPQIGN